MTTPNNKAFSGPPHQSYSFDSPKVKLTSEVAVPLIEWFEEHRDHPYPSRQDKVTLCQMTGLTFTQVGCVWYEHYYYWSPIPNTRVCTDNLRCQVSKISSVYVWVQCTHLCGANCIHKEKYFWWDIFVIFELRIVVADSFKYYSLVFTCLVFLFHLAMA